MPADIVYFFTNAADALLRQLAEETFTRENGTREDRVFYENRSSTRDMRITSLAFKYIEGDIMSADEKDIYFKEARIKILEEALIKLSPQKRKVFDLCKIQGKSYEESARELNISKHTVKEYLSIAVKAVKEYAEQHPLNNVLFIYIIVALKIIL